MAVIRTLVKREPVLLIAAAAALLLSGFTQDARSLLLGVNIGGLGTPIASLASLNSMKLYAHSDRSRAGRYLAEFTLVNVALLLLLSFIQSLFRW